MAEQNGASTDYTFTWRASWHLREMRRRSPNLFSHGFYEFQILGPQLVADYLVCNNLDLIKNDIIEVLKEIVIILQEKGRQKYTPLPSRHSLDWTFPLELAGILGLAKKKSA